MGNKYILCVDDEESILISLESQLKRSFGNEYLYEFAENATDAMEILEELNEEENIIVIIVSDWLMPGIKGDEFLVNAHKKFPKIAKILLTGQATKEAIENAVKNANLHRCLKKPWDSDELVETIQTALEK